MPSLRVNRHLPTAFHEIEPAGFERMTLALLATEPGITSTALYRVQRQPQFGIDVIAHRRDGTKDVASCKCYQSVRKGQLAEWSNDFLDHWDGHWCGQKIRRFILVVAADVHSRERDDEVEAERARFGTVGVDYEVWAPDQLQEKLRPHRGIVAQHVGPEHVGRICGDLPGTGHLAAGGGILADGMAADLADSLRTLASGALRQRIEHAQARFRSGHVTETAAVLDELGAGQGWDIMPAADKARVLRLRAHLRIHMDDDASALALADAADELSPQEEPRLRAFLAYRREGTTAALAVLGHPATQDGAHLRAALLLQRQDVQEAATMLGTPPVDPGDAETLRLQSYVALMSGDQTEALRLADMALSRAPDRPEMTRAAAVARYAAALSPVLEWTRAVQATPVPIDLVRDDDVSRGHLLRAHELFGSLLHKELPRTDQRDVRVSALACICNLRERMDEASRYLASMLAEDPGWAAAAQWGLARGLPMERERLRRELHKQAGDRPEDAEGRILLAILEAEEGNVSQAIGLLRASTCFTTPEALATRDEWIDLLRRRSTPGGEPPGPGEADLDDLPQMVRRAEEDGNWSTLEGWMDRAASTRPFPQTAIVPIAQALAAAGRWEAPSRHLDTLLSLATPEPIRIAAYAATYTGRHDIACRILSQHRTAFRGSRLPADLARLEAEALAGSGDQSGAIRAATLLAHAEGATAADHVTAALAHLRTGNPGAAIPFADLARRSGQLSQRHAVGLAQALSTVNSDVASSLLQDALAGPLEPRLAAGAISTALRLGMDRQVAPLLANLHLLSKEPGSGIVSVSIDDLPTMHRERGEAAEQAASLYRAGQVPIHLALGSTGGNLASFYQLDEASADSRGNCPLLLQSGCVPDGVQAANGIDQRCLRLDITALLVVDQLGMMDVLEGMEGAILIPPSLPMALLWLREDLRPPQPERLSAMRRTLTAVTDGTLAELLGAAGTAGSTDPQGDHGVRQVRWILVAGEASLDAGDKEGSGTGPMRPPARLDMRGLADGLLDEGAIDVHQHGALLERFGPGILQETAGNPVRGNEIVLPGPVAVELAALGLLESAAVVFGLLIPAPDLAEIKVSVQQDDRRQPVVERLDLLSGRIARNLAQGVFRTLPSMPGKDDEPGPVKGCLLELARAGDPGTSLTWIDDRWATGRQLPGGDRVIGTVEMLCRFETSGLIGQARRWGAMNRLRAGNAQFIAAEPGEVLHHLQAAPIRDGRLVETPALATLRMHLARAIQASANLDVTPVREGRGRGELPFLLALRRSAEDALLAIWVSDGQDDGQRRLRSDWVWSSLRVDRLPDIGLPATAVHGWRQVLGLSHAALLANGLQVLTRTGRSLRKQRLRDYMRWVTDRALPPWAQVDEEFTGHVVETLAILLKEIGSGKRGGRGAEAREANFVQAMLGELVLALPEPFQVRLLQREGIRERVGLRREDVTEVEGRTFVSRLFWDACARALTGAPASVACIDGFGTLSLLRCKGKDDALQLSGCLSGTLIDPVIGLMSPSKAARLRATRSFLDRLGLSPAEGGAAMARIMGARRRAERIEIAQELRQASLVTSQRALQDRLASGANVPWADFSPPSPSILLRHVGLEPCPMVPIRERLDAAARQLLSDFGAVEAVLRFTSLPLPLPGVLLEAVEALPQEGIESLEAALCGEAATPVRTLHGLRVMRLLVSRGRVPHERFEPAVQAATSRWRAIAEPFTVLLHQFGEELHPDGPLSFGLRPDEACAAAWLHADHVMQAIQATTTNLGKATRRLRERPIRVQAARTVTKYPRYDGMAAATGRVTGEVLLFHGLGYALGVEGPDLPSLATEGALDVLRRTMSQQMGDTWVPVPWLLSNRDGAPDDLGSWFGLRPAWIFGENGGMDAETARRSILSTLAELNVPQPGRPLLWAFCGWLAHPFIGRDGRGLAAAAVKEVDLLALAREDPDIGAEALVFAARVAQVSEDEGAIAALGDALVRYAEAQGGTCRAPVSPDQADVLPELLEAVALVSGSVDERRGWDTFSALVIRIARAWPGNVPFLRETVGALTTAAHPEHAVALWNTWVELRALR